MDHDAQPAIVAKFSGLVVFEMLDGACFWWLFIIYTTIQPDSLLKYRAIIISRDVA